MEQTHTNLQRKLLLTWLIVPIIIIWFTTNYLIGIFRPPMWQNAKSNNNLISLSNNPIDKVESPPQIPKYQWQGTGLVTLWFDDGWISQYTTGFPLVDQYGYKAALAVPTHLIGYDAYMGWAQVRRLQSKGWEITAHTRTHDCNIYKEDQKTVDYELGGSASDLKQMGLNYNNFVSPCGVNSPIMEQIAQKYFLSFRTSEPGFNNIPVDDPYYLLVQTMQTTVTLDTVKQWLQTAKNNHQWLILVFHQIGDTTSQYSITTTMLHDILNEIKNDVLPVVLPIQALELEGLDVQTSSPSAKTTRTYTNTQSIQSNIHE